MPRHKNRQIRSTDPAAIGQLYMRIKRTEDERERMVLINRLVREARKRTEGHRFRWFVKTAEEQVGLGVVEAGDIFSKGGYTGGQIHNIGGEIRRLRKRVLDLSKTQTERTEYAYATGSTKSEIRR